MLYIYWIVSIMNRRNNLIINQYKKATSSGIHAFMAEDIAMWYITVVVAEQKYLLRLVIPENYPAAQIEFYPLNTNNKYKPHEKICLGDDARNVLHIEDYIILVISKITAEPAKTTFAANIDDLPIDVINWFNLI